MEDVLVVGARGLGVELISYIEQAGTYNIAGVLDEIQQPDVLGYTIIHPKAYGGECRDAFFAVGYPWHKQNILDLYRPLGLTWRTFVDPRAYVSPHAKVGEGSLIAPFSVIAGNAQVGNHALVNAHASIGHDAIIGDRVSLQPKAFVGGGAHIEDDVLVAVDANVLPDLTIGASSRVAAGAVVHRSMPDKSIIFGNPARAMPDTAMMKGK